MSKLIGTNPNQVPSNADLGTAAFMDAKEFLTARGSSVSAIDAVISKTATDVFVYDTRKDSDGGEWRKRTQHTSWYNEKLNTPTRGSRREFPAVAVIVAESARLTIYDGDDPSMPMWMVFDLSGAVGSASNMIPRGGSGNESSITSVAFLNTKLIVGLKGAGNYGEGPIEINFISDFSRVYREVGSGFTGAIYSLRISGRNSNGAYKGDYNELAILVQTVNDVAMTVLPNAPIDSATGLPVPTIAVATDGGVSVIKDNGTVVDITVNNASYTYARRVNFLSDNSLGMGIGVSNGVAQESYYIFKNIPRSDNVITVDNIAGTVQNVDEFYAIQHPNSLVDLQILGLDSNRSLNSSTGNSFASDKGLSIISRNVVAPDKGMVAYIASDYNTGWNVGNTKLATLSDTDATDIDDRNFVTNGDMSTSDTSSFLPYNSGALGATVSITSGELKLTHTGTTNYAFARVIFDAEIGQVYTVKGRLKNGNASYAQVKPHSGCTFKPSEKVHSGTSYEDFHFTVTATSTSVQFRLQLVGSNGQYAYFDDIVAKVAEADRTLINNNSLEVLGTVKKTPVAAGADLVAYSGFTTSNYLEQPYNSSMDVGTGEFCVTGWFKGVASTSVQTLFHRRPPGAPNINAIEIGFNTDETFYFATTNGSGAFSNTALSGYPVQLGVWTHFACVRRNGVMSTYLNGNLYLTSYVVDRDISNTSAVTRIGAYINTGASYGWGGDASLIRMSATVPTSEQIKKMYEDEKVLFQENAKATLYGTSDAVIALAYDDSTNLLHAGTSAGRSVFQGLSRIDNTTDAVGTAISASNGMVVEE